MEHINFEKYEVNEELREITFSCCSDTPYERYDDEADLFYNQILVISEDAVDLSRLNNGAPLLFNHDADKLLGMVQQAYIIENKVFVKVRFSRNDEFAERIFRDILDGVIKNVSIGYQILAYEDKKQNGSYNRYITKWLIFETSIVSVPADPYIGIRSKNLKNIKEVKNMEENKPIETPVEAPETETPAEVVEEVKEIETEAPAEEVAEVEAEVKEASELEALQQENEALKAEVENLQRLIQEAPEPEQEAPAEDEAPELDEEEKEEIKAIGKDFEIPEEEVRKALAEKLTVREFKQKIKTFNITKKEKRNMNRKAFRDYLQNRNFDVPFTLRDFAGFSDANLVATETLPLVAMLEKRMGLKGYRTLAGLNSQIQIPVQKSGVTVTTPGINEASTDSNPTFEKLTLAPVKFVASTVIGKEMLTVANSDVEAFIIDEITRQLAYEVENYMLGKIAEGAGTEINYSALNSFTWADAVAFEAAIGGYNLTDAQFVMSASARAALKGIEKAEGTARFICEDNAINGYPVSVSGCVKNDNIYFGAMENLVLASFDDLNIIIDPYTEARSGAVVVVGSICIDAGLTAPEAFAIGKVQESSSSSESSN